MHVNELCLTGSCCIFNTQHHTTHTLLPVPIHAHPHPQHASGPNKTDKPRRIIYTTYAKKSEGDLRDRYYADKRKSFPPDIERDPNQTYEYKI